jgi:hypothetical protein
MKRFLMFVALSLLLTIGYAATAQDPASQIIGVWKATEIIRKEVDSGKTEKPYGDKLTAYFIYTRQGVFSWTFVAENRKKPAGAALTDAERIELFNTMSFGTGTFKVEGGKIIHRYDSSWHHAWAGMERVTPFPVITGKKMVNTSAPFRSGASGMEQVVIQTFERIE